MDPTTFRYKKNNREFPNSEHFRCRINSGFSNVPCGGVKGLATFYFTEQIPHFFNQIEDF